MGKYYYKGKSLYQYCKNNNIKYRNIIGRINLILQENPTIDKTELVEKAVNMESRVKYYYNGILLIDYCKQNNISYTTIKSRIKKIISENNKLDMNKVIEMAINDFNNSRVKYYYNGESLYEYCNKNKINYSTIKNRIHLILKQNPDINEIELIEQAINKESKIKYYYDGILLKDYCKENKIDYDTIIKKIRTCIVYNNIDDINIIIDAILKEYKHKIKYYYNGESLYEYCNKNKINYSTIKNRIHLILKQKPDITNDELIEQAINMESKVKYYYDGDTLYNYCKQNDISYTSLKYSINLKLKNNDDCLLDEIVSDLIIRAEERKYIKEIREIFSKLNDNTTLEEIHKICNVLNINYCDFTYMKQKYNFSIKKTISILWFYQNDDNNKLLKGYNGQESENFFERLFKLYKMYKCDILDTRINILEMMKKRIFKFINNINNKYYLQLTTENIVDIYSEANLSLFAAIDRCYENSSPYRFYFYINKCICGQLLTYIFKQYYFKYTSLDKLNDLEKSLYEYLYKTDEVTNIKIKKYAKKQN